MLDFFKKIFSNDTSTPQTIESRYDQIEKIVKIIEVSDAAPFISSLFRKKFNQECPDYPRHFVAFYKPENRPDALPIGYFHHTPHEKSYLAGGFVIDDTAYRKIPAEHRKIIRSAGGIAEYLATISIQLLGDRVDAIWGIVGNIQSENVLLRVGFEHTPKKHLMVLWRSPQLTQKHKNILIENISKLEPF